MLARRIIPLFLLRGARLFKGEHFKDWIDIGDPVSQGLIYDAQGADEIIIVDIDASREDRIINTKIIAEMVNKCRLPIVVGGGIKNVADARKCFEAGADKIVINTHAIINPTLVKEMTREFGSQSIVVSIDVKKSPAGNYEIFTYSGTEKATVGLEELTQNIVEYKAGEILITSIDKEGSLSGFDCELYRRLRDLIPVPLIASGGAGSYDHMVELFEKTDCDACAIGKMLFLRDYDIIRIKSYLKGKNVIVREA